MQVSLDTLELLVSPAAPASLEPQALPDSLEALALLDPQVHFEFSSHLSP